MTITESNTRTLPVIDGWAVRDLPGGDQIRARIVHDPHYSEPERGAGMWNEGVILVRERDGYRGIDLDEHEGLARVLDRVNHDGRYWWVERHDANDLDAGERMWDADKTMEENWKRTEHDLHGEAGAHEFIRRYLRAFWDVQHVSLRHHSGYSQSDWADIWVIVEGVEEGANVEGIADATWTEWDAWAKGDVYTIESETRTLLDAMEAGDSEGGWAADDMVGVYYGDDDAAEALAETLGVDVSTLPRTYDVTLVTY